MTDIGEAWSAYYRAGMLAIEAKAFQAGWHAREALERTEQPLEYAVEYVPQYTLPGRHTVRYNRVSGELSARNLAAAWKLDEHPEARAVVRVGPGAWKELS